MPFVDCDNRDIEFKILFYGPRGAGKNSSLRMIEDLVENGTAPNWTSVNAGKNRRTVFSFVPLAVHVHKNWTADFHLLTPPADIHHRKTGEHLLARADGVIFVADSSWSRMEANLESYKELQANMSALGRDIHDLPLVFNYNKRDVDAAAPLRYMDYLLNNGTERRPAYETVAAKGIGIFSGLNAIAKLLTIQSHRYFAGADDSVSSRENAGSASDGPQAELQV